MENRNNNENEIKKEPQIEVLDSDFLKELNELSKKLKTDDEIINDNKSKKLEQNKDNNNIKTKNEFEQKKINKINTEMDKINKLFINNNSNDNPFIEAYNNMNLTNNNFNLNDNDLMFESLDLLNSNVSEFNNILNKLVNLNNTQNEMDEKEKNILGEIYGFLIQSNLLKDTILIMKKSIEESFEKNQNNLKKEEKEKYQEALLNAETIIKETDKLHPDKNKIMDCILKLQKISNDIDSISFI